MWLVESRRLEQCPLSCLVPPSPCVSSASRSRSTIPIGSLDPTSMASARACWPGIAASWFRGTAISKSWPYLAEEIAHAVRAHSAVLDGEIVCLDAELQ